MTPFVPRSQLGWSLGGNGYLQIHPLPLLSHCASLALKSLLNKFPLATVMVGTEYRMKLHEDSCSV